MKKISEKKLSRIINESLKHVLNEEQTDNFTISVGDEVVDKEGHVGKVTSIYNFETDEKVDSITYDEAEQNRDWDVYITDELGKEFSCNAYMCSPHRSINELSDDELAEVFDVFHNNKELPDRSFGVEYEELEKAYETFVKTYINGSMFANFVKGGFRR